MAEDTSMEEVFEFDCPDCGTHIVGEVDHCPKCGIEFDFEEVEEFVCPRCGEVVGEVGRCPNCGTEFEIAIDEPDTPTDPDPIVAPLMMEALESEQDEPIQVEPELETEGIDPSVEALSEPGPSTEVNDTFIHLSDPLAEAKEGGDISEAPVPELKAKEPEPPPKSFAQVQEEFPQLVDQIKDLLALANEHGIDSQGARTLIDRTVTAGRNKDLDQAIELAKQCMDSIKTAISNHLEGEALDLTRFAETSERLGKDPAVLLEHVSTIRALHESGDLGGALEYGREGRRVALELTGRYVEANDLCDRLEGLIQNVERFYVDVREPRELLNEAKDAGLRDDWDTMAILAQKGISQMQERLPSLLEEGLVNGKDLLLKLKMEGKNVSLPIKLLKEASVMNQSGDHEGALSSLVEFKAEVKRL